jgi:hypothetical protein
LKNIIHITTDEKFINAAYKQFLSLNFQNEFYIISRKSIEELKYVTPKKGINVIYPKYSALTSLAKKFKNSIIVFHGFSFYASVLCKNVEKTKNNSLIWIVWGSEFYFNPYIYKRGKYEFLGPLTSQLELKLSKTSYVKKVASDIKTKVIQILNKTYSPLSYNIYSQMKRMDAVGALFLEECDLVSRKLGSNFKFVNYTYYPIELMVNDSSKTVSGPNILVGNSSSSTNNHLEVFDFLKKQELNEKKIIVPLSYGDEHYRDHILNVGQDYFGDSFDPMLQFLPVNEYFNVLSSCSIVFMNHYRQQSVGNIMTMLYLGAKVYLSNKTTVFRYLNRIGIKVFSFEIDIHNHTEEVLEPLSKENQIHNRTILKNELAQSYLLQSLKESILTCN